MEFRLYYRGRLTANGPPPEKWLLRRRFHEQLARLWNQEPLAGTRSRWLSPDTEEKSVLMTVGPFTFAPLVSSKLGVAAELDILFLRLQAPGAIVAYGGDLDNRVKTLLDALRVPDVNQIGRETPMEREVPFFCLLQDDILVTRLAVTADQLLDSDDRD